jgi:hypothetical protein
MKVLLKVEAILRTLQPSLASEKINTVIADKGFDSDAFVNV